MNSSRDELSRRSNSPIDNPKIALTPRNRSVSGAKVNSFREKSPSMNNLRERATTKMKELKPLL